MRPSALILLVLVGCNGKDGEEVEGLDPDEQGLTIDADDDGYPESEDCDDQNAAAYPGADEVCDEADNDCDGATDEDALDGSVFYADADGDGYGDAGASTAACELPAGHVEDSNDCDDSDAAIHPGAEESCEEAVDYNCDGSVGDADDDADGWVACLECDDADAGVNPDASEVCDSVDNDCDALTDDADDSLSGAPAWYTDADGDGYGEQSPAAYACEQPAGAVAEAGDCDDGSAAISPESDELCDLVDNDCDGLADEDALDAATWYVDSDGDGQGDASLPVLGCDQPAGASGSMTDCDDADPGVYLGADEVCDGIDNDCDGDLDGGALDADAWYADDDGDTYGDPSSSLEACDQPAGYVADDQDCDDADAGVSPAAAEACDEIDNDCDGVADDGVDDGATWYADGDSDGYGDPGETAIGCAPPAGYVGNDDDCDDGDAGANPGESEVCGGDDEDCDGTTDEGSAIDADTWYLDADDDGYGDPGSVEEACDLPAGYVANDDDCDDADDASHPGGAEVCDDADNDCDGTNDDNAADAATWHRDADSDGYGDPDVALDRCDAPAGYVADDDDCDDGEAAVNPGLAEVCDDGLDNDCDGTPNDCSPSGVVGLASADAIRTGKAAADLAGSALDLVGDVDGDGTGDLLVGAWSADAPAKDGGAAYLVRGPIAGTASLSAAAATIGGDTTLDYAGIDVAAAGDADGDGYADVLVGAYKEDSGGTDAGSVYLYAGPLAGSLTFSAADASILGEEAYDFAGWALDGGLDADGDGVPDAVVGAQRRNNGALADAGAAYLVSGALLTGAFDLADADAAWLGSGADDYAGYAVALAPDTDGDGLADVLVGAYAEDTGGSNAGAAYLALGGAAGSASLDSADAILIGESAADKAGYAVDGAGDVDGDGYGDVLVGAYDNDAGGTGAGRAYLILGPASGSIDLSAADAIFTGGAAGDYLGVSVAGIGDLNNDGLADVALGATGQDSGGSNAGAVYAWYGPAAGSLAASSADATLRGAAASDAAGASLAGGDDIDGDGVGDLAVGATGQDAGGSNAGAAYLVFGGGL